MLYEQQFLGALGFTIGVEFLVIIILIKFFLPRLKIPSPLLFATVFLASFATLPYLWFIFPAFIKQYKFLILSGELFIVAVESLIYFLMWHISYKQALILSFFSNLCSFLLGQLLFY